MTARKSRETTGVLDDQAPAGLDGYTPPPYVPPPTLDERLVKVWGEVTRTPAGTVLALVDLVALIALLASLRSIPVTAVDAAGPLRANCGLSFYVGGASNPAVDSACRYAFSSRIPQVVLLLVVMAVVTSVLVHSIVRPDSARGAWRALVRTPLGAAVAVLDVTALVVALIALQPVGASTSDGAAVLNAHCGLGYFLFGGPVPAVDHACRSAYAPRAALFFVALALFLAGTGWLVRAARAGRRQAR